MPAHRYPLVLEFRPDDPVQPGEVGIRVPVALPGAPHCITARFNVMIHSILGRVAAALGSRRSELPAWFAAITEYALEHPHSALGKLAYQALGGEGEVPDNWPALDARCRVYIGPLNYAGQGYLWARALRENLPWVEAVNAAVVAPRSHLTFAADIRLPLSVYRGSREWRDQQQAYLRGFTHVISEGGQSLIGERRSSDPFDEFASLRDDGVATAVLLHGSDARLPSRHSRNNPASPFADLRKHKGAEVRVARLLDRLQVFDGPILVSTPDLLIDVPQAQWCPVVVDPATWSAEEVPLQREVPIVIHAPSRASVKGTHLIEPIVRKLDDEGLISYRRIEGVAPEALPNILRSADVVLDQFALGSYGVAACEAMAAGRVVVGSSTAQVRGVVRESAGMELPIVQAEANELERSLRRIVAHRDEYVAIAQRGVEFVAQAHSGRLSAKVMARSLRLDECR